jgi:hypothetical protein
MWNFHKLGEGEPERSPHEAEFFNVGDLDWSAAVVRESIQNSLDAKLPSSDKILVRFSLKSEPVSKFTDYYSDLIPHVKSCDFSFNPETKKDFKYLIIEDFGTIGLDGPITRTELKNQGKSNYYNFWWREGISLKEGRDAGRWGLGKTVFFISSELRSFWGYTIRSNDKRELLLGKSLLKSHQFDDTQYDYYAYYSVKDNQPIESPDSISDFKKRFGITRRDEPGLSIIIPYPVEDISTHALIRAVIQHYFYPIIKGTLIVEIEDNSHSFTIDHQSIFELAKKQNWKETSWENHSVESILFFVYNSVKTEDENFLKLLNYEGAPKISEALFGNNLEYAQKRFNENNLVSLHIPIKIESIDGSSQDSYFRAFIQKDENLSRPEEFYVRSGILVSEIKMIRGNVRALLTAEDELVAKFLGDSESPAHTDWKERTESFKQKYKLATYTLRFVRSSMRDLIKILDIPPKGIDKDFLKEIFNIPNEVGKTLGERPSDEFIPDSFVKEDTFNIQKIKGGFKIGINKKEGFKPISAHLEVAYNTKRGNPFSKYDRWDFVLSLERKEPNSIIPEITDGRITRIVENFVMFNIENPNFALKMTGFDPNRELVVSLK